MTADRWWLSWSLDPDLAVALVLVAGSYVAGVRRLAGGPLRVPPHRRIAFVAGWLSIVVALVSPLDSVAAFSFAAHMIQHMVLLLVAPPLLLMGGAATVVLAGLPALGRRTVVSVGRRLAAGRLGRQLQSRWNPEAALVLFVAVLWLWHLPAPYDWALGHQLVHEVEHGSYLLAGLAYWHWVVAALDRRLPSGLLLRRLGYVAAGLLGCWLLGVVLGLAMHPLYEGYLTAGRSPVAVLADQQLGAGIMWAPGMVPFDIAGAVLVQRWLASDARAATRRSPVTVSADGQTAA